MKILYVSNVTSSTSIGGMEYHLLDITEWLAGRGVDIAMAVREGTFFYRTFLRDKPNIYPLSWTGYRKLFSFIQLGKAIRDFAPDIISINRERDIIRVYVIAKCVGPFLKKKPKLVAMFHNPIWKRFFVLDKLDGIIFPSYYLKQGCARNNRFAESRAAVIPHGIHLPSADPGGKFDPGRQKRYFIGRNFPLIGMIGELRKNQTDLVDAAFELQKKNIDFTVVFIGGGDEADFRSLQEKIDRLGLTKNFLFTGRVERDRMPDILYDLDVSVTTIRSEAFGLVYIESLASYTPVIAYRNSGGPAEILSEGGGILADGPADMAEAIFTIVTNDGLRKSLGTAGRASVEKNFSYETMGNRHYAFYQQLICPSAGEARAT